MNPSTMYGAPSSVYADVVQLADGPDVITTLALERIRAGQPTDALHLTDVALASDSHTTARSKHD